MRRREFIARLGSAAAWPVAVRAQQPTMPLIGLLGIATPPAFLEALAETGYVIGRNVRFEYRWTEDASQMPALAADLVKLRAAVIFAGTLAGALAAKAATAIIPIVFAIGDDPVRLGLVASLSRPGGNVTGATNVTVELEGKRLAMMYEIVPAVTTIAALVDTKSPSAERQTNDIRKASQNLGRSVRVLHAASESEIDDAFTRIIKEKLGALFVTADAYFSARRAQIVTLAAHYANSAFYPRREFAEAGGLASYGTDPDATFRQGGIYVGRILKGEPPGDLPVQQPARDLRRREIVEAGGLISYGPSISDAYRLVGTYAGRILKGEKPSGLPVQQSTKVQLVINMKTAKALGLTVPNTLLVSANEVIE
jgi:putative tryptophan/tyrosine transport system substrate-binding protein